jgi:hypothetical protein
MPFRVSDFQTLVRALERRPEWRAELRRLLLTDELLRLPRTVQALTREVRRLAEAQARTEQQLEALVHAQTRAEERLARLEEAQIRAEDRLARLEEAQIRAEDRLARLEEAQIRAEDRLARLEETLRGLSEEVRQLVRTIGRMEERWGLSHEQIAEDLLPEILRRKGWQVHRVGRLEFDGEVDLVVAVEVQGRVFTLAAEVKGRVWSRTPGEEVRRKLSDPAFLEALRRQGFPAPVVPAVFGMLVYTGAEEAAARSGVGLFTPRGELVSPPVP